MSLSQGGLLLIALLSKSDYSDGLRGCGSNISTALVRCGYGDRILSAFTKHLGNTDNSCFMEDMERLVCDIQAELCSNSQGFLSSRSPKLASRLTSDCFSFLKVSAFLDPVTSPESQAQFPSWIAREPCIPRIAQFCRQVLLWNDTTLEENFSHNLWSGVFLRLITLVSRIYLLMHTII